MIKRLFDVVCSMAGLIVLWPLFVGLAVLVKFTSPGPALHRAVRVGRYGATFHLLKFRSMVVNADKIGPGITGAADPRVTSTGRFLRRTKLDELPQLINVLRGDMSLVGPRPEDPRYVALYTAEQRKVLDVRPGITSLASIRYRDEEAILIGADWERHYVEHVMPEKLGIELEYLKSSNLKKDVEIIITTLKPLFL
jgi:lipopolysaccharide/colanic/teichoic acid biosynthesis glycosyltransferase